MTQKGKALVEKLYDKKIKLARIETQKIRARLVATIVHVVGMVVLLYILLSPDFEAAIAERLIFAGVGWLAAVILRK